VPEPLAWSASVRRRGSPSLRRSRPCRSSAGSAHVVVFDQAVVRPTASRTSWSGRLNAADHPRRAYLGGWRCCRKRDTTFRMSSSVSSVWFFRHLWPTNRIPFPVSDRDAQQNAEPTPAAVYSPPRSGTVDELRRRRRAMNPPLRALTYKPHPWRPGIIAKKLIRCPWEEHPKMVRMTSRYRGSEMDKSEIQPTPDRRKTPFTGFAVGTPPSLPSPSRRDRRRSVG
jgi:hypothetical protein